MEFTWDEHKSRINRAKHKISFETARLVFEDPHHLSYQDRHENGEDRWQTLGLVDGVAVLLVAHTVQDDDEGEVIRIISARRAEKRERRLYEQQAY